MKTKYKILIALCLVVVFGLGVTAGVLGERYFVHKKYRRPSSERPHPPSREGWAKELGLTQEQQDKIREIFKRNEERMKVYHSEGLAKLREIRRQLRDEIDAVLTPEQKKKNDDMLRRFEDRRRTDIPRNTQRSRVPSDPRPHEANPPARGRS